jgi:hypothetical protein
MPNLGSSRAPLNIMTEIVIIFFISQDYNLRHRVFLSNVFVAPKHYFL